MQEHDLTIILAFVNSVLVPVVGLLINTIQRLRSRITAIEITNARIGSAQEAHDKADDLFHGGLTAALDKLNASMEKLQIDMHRLQVDVATILSDKKRNFA